RDRSRPRRPGCPRRRAWRSPANTHLAVPGGAALSPRLLRGSVRQYRRGLFPLLCRDLCEHAGVACRGRRSSTMRLCPNLHFMYRELPFLERFAAAAGDGFAGVEMTFPYDTPAVEIRAAADRAAVAIVEFNAPAGPIVPGVRRGLAA